MIITVQCPACETTFPVDPRKVPEGGVKVRCSSCSGIFFVAKPEVPSVDDLAPSAEPRADAAPEPGAPAPAEAAAAPAEAAWPAASAASAGAASAAGWAVVEGGAPAPVAPDVAPAEAEPAQDWDDALEEARAEAEPLQHRDDALEEARAEVDSWGGADFDDPSEGVHHDHGSPDPWAGGLDLPETDDAAPAADAAEAPESPVVERLETVEDVTRAAAADFPSADPLDDPDDAWGEAAPAAEAPVSSFDEAPLESSFDDDEPDASFEEAAPSSFDDEAGGSLGQGDTPAHPVDSGASVEVAAPPVAAPAPSKFQFGRRDPDDKARRLARVLVSDIITYNPERHQQALEADTLHADFEEEIRKSWAEYVEQVGRELAESTPYWFDALNEILARGRKVF